LGKIHIISLISAIFLFIGIILTKLKDLKTNLTYLITIIAYWLIATVIMLFGVIIDAIIWIVLQDGLDRINITFGHVLMTETIKIIMVISFPALFISVITIKKSGYINNFNKIFISAVMLLIVPDILLIITATNILQTNFVFYTIFNDVVGSVLLGIILSLIITKLNMIIFKESEIGKIYFKSYALVAITLTMFLSLIIYLLFINQFPSKTIIKLTDWRVITMWHNNETRTIISDVIKPDTTKSDLSKYKNYKITSLHIHGPIGNMNVNSTNYKLNQDDNIIISSARLNIEKNNKKELVIDVISRSVNVKDQIIPMTLWSSLSSNQKTTIIAGIFLVISSIIASITAIYVKFQKDT
jgi:hypothetical protein